MGDNPNSIQIDDADTLADASVIEQREAQLAEARHALKRLEDELQYQRMRVLRANHRLSRYRKGAEATLLAPLRLFRSIARRVTGKQRIDVVPLYQLEADDAGQWVAVGADPQFLLVADINWPRLGGWHWFEIQVDGGAPLDAQLYFDLGQGFSPDHTVCFELPQRGLVRVPLYIPVDCRHIRLDPCSRPGSFRLERITLHALREAPAVPEGMRAIMHAYAAMGGATGNAAVLAPGHLISRSNLPGYAWRSDGIDPWFKVGAGLVGARKGWFIIDLQLDATVDGSTAKLYIDYGQGFSEAGAIALPFRSGVSVSRVVYLASTPRAVRFDPVECVTAFSVARLHIERISARHANRLMAERVRESLDAEADSATLDKLMGDSGVRSGGDADLQLRKMYDATFRHDPSSIDYAEWIQRNERPLFSDVDRLRQHRDEFKHKPTVSIVMPVYNPDTELLGKAIDSVLAQSYASWQLCIADDASPNPQVRAVLQQYADRDARIKVVFREKNGHISAASNTALELATGEYVALLDHDDELSMHALHFIVDAINRHPTARIIYTDEDKIDETGFRCEPHFKSSWNPDLFYAQNYVSHLGVYEHALLRRIGGFRLGVEGSQDQDLLLRCLPLVDPADIVHVPMVLYHWRITQGSTAQAASGKSYTTRAGVKALQDHFKAQGLEQVVVEEGLAPNTYRVRYPVPHPAPLVSLLIPTRDKVELLRACIESILQKTTYPNYEILVLDNESIEQATLEYFEAVQQADSRVRVLPYHQPFNYSAINNFGAQEARGEVLGLINNDVEVISSEWLTEMVSHAMRPEIGCVGAKLYYGDDTLQHAGVILGLGGVAGHSHKYFPRSATGYFSRLQVVQNLSAVTAACLVVRKSVYMQVGGLEEEALRVAFNDVDFCLKVREAGYRNLWTPYAELYHHESKSRGAEDTPEKQARFTSEVGYMQEKWGGHLQADPYYSRNLTATREDFSLA